MEKYIKTSNAAEIVKKDINICKLSKKILDKQIEYHHKMAFLQLEFVKVAKEKRKSIMEMEKLLQLQVNEFTSEKYLMYMQIQAEIRSHEIPTEKIKMLMREVAICAKQIETWKIEIDQIRKSTPVVRKINNYKLKYID